MSWNTLYLPPDKTQWRGRTDTPPASSFFQIIQMLNLLDYPENVAKQHAFALIGFRSDEGIRRNFGRIGAAEGPKAIRHALSKLPIQKQNFICFDAGDIICVDGDLEAAQHALGEVIALLLQHNMTPIALGGGHEIAWGHYQGIHRAFPDEHLGIINFDAHFDMRPLLDENKGSSGTPFLQIANAHKHSQRPFHYHCIGIQQTGNIPSLFTTAEHYQTHVIEADIFHQGDHQPIINLINQIITESDILYLSLCLDVFSSAYAPGVSAPQALGLTPWQVIPYLRKLAESGKVVSYDIAEYSPQYDIDLRTAKLAALFIYQIIHYHKG
jgi:formiminoglutamase